MAAEIDEALCIRHWEWSETSQTVALFTRGRGVVRALAKGSRRPKAPYSGGIELLTVAEIGLIARPQSDLALLTYWDLRRTFPALRTELAAHNAGMFIADMLVQFVRDHDPHAALYEAALAALGRMTSAAAVPRALLSFQWALFSETGFKPELDADVRTGEMLGPEPAYIFHAEAGGLTRETDADGPRPAGAWRIRAETVELLRAVAAGREPALADRTRTGAALDRANRLLASYARHTLGFETPTMGAVFGDRLAR